MQGRIVSRSEAMQSNFQGLPFVVVVKLLISCFAFVYARWSLSRSPL